MIYAVLSALLIAGLHFYFQERVKKKVAYILHIQGKTEEAEVMDFTVSLFQDESMDEWKKKIYTAFELQEERRTFTNERIIRQMEEERAKLKITKKAEG